MISDSCCGPRLPTARPRPWNSLIFSSFTSFLNHVQVLHLQVSAKLLPNLHLCSFPPAHQLLSSLPPSFLILFLPPLLSVQDFLGNTQKPPSPAFSWKSTLCGVSALIPPDTCTTSQFHSSSMSDVYCWRTLIHFQLTLGRVPIPSKKPLTP